MQTKPVSTSLAVFRPQRALVGSNPLVEKLNRLKTAFDLTEDSWNFGTLVHSLEREFKRNLSISFSFDNVCEKWVRTLPKTKREVWLGGIIQFYHRLLEDPIYRRVFVSRWNNDKLLQRLVFDVRAPSIYFDVRELLPRCSNAPRFLISIPELLADSDYISPENVNELKCTVYPHPEAYPWDISLQLIDGAEGLPLDQWPERLTAASRGVSGWKRITPETVSAISFALFHLREVASANTGHPVQQIGASCRLRVDGKLVYTNPAENSQPLPIDSLSTLIRSKEGQANVNEVHIPCHNPGWVNAEAWIADEPRYRSGLDGNQRFPRCPFISPHDPFSRSYLAVLAAPFKIPAADSFGNIGTLAVTFVAAQSDLAPNTWQSKCEAINAGMTGNVSAPTTGRLESSEWGRRISRVCDFVSVMLQRDVVR